MISLVAGGRMKFADVILSFVVSIYRAYIKVHILC